MQKDDLRGKSQLESIEMHSNKLFIYQIPLNAVHIGLRTVKQRHSGSLIGLRTVHIVLRSVHIGLRAVQLRHSGS